MRVKQISFISSAIIMQRKLDKRDIWRKNLLTWILLKSKRNKQRRFEEETGHVIKSREVPHNLGCYFPFVSVSCLIHILLYAIRKFIGLRRRIQRGRKTPPIIIMKLCIIEFTRLQNGECLTHMQHDADKLNFWNMTN